MTRHADYRIVSIMRGSRKYCHIVRGGGGGPTLTTVVLVDEGRENPNTIISGL